jgi:SNF2 family DNA or RNA helicase
MKYVPQPHNVDGIKFILSRTRAGLFFKPGLGKTAMTLSAITKLIGAGAVDRVLVIAPIRVCNLVWPREIAKWDEFNHLSHVILHGKDKDTLVRQKSDIYIINPEGLPWLINNHVALFRKYKFMLVCDESTVFKNHGSSRFKLLRKILPCFERRVILTGTPAPNGLMQLWSQLFILDDGARLGKTITWYRQQFFTRSYNGFGYDLINGAKELIYGRINDIVMHKGDDVLSLPDKLFNTIEVELPTQAMKVYKDVKEHFIAEHEDETTITALNSASQAIKLKQIANGAIYTEGKSVLSLHDEKIKVIAEMLDSLGGRPLLVAYEFLHDLQRLKEAFGDAPYIGGGSKDEEQTVAMWNKGMLPLMFIHPKAGGHGLNLQDGGCQDVIWFSLTFDLELYDQLNARAHRQGVKNAVTIHHIVAINTVDEKVVKALERKALLQDSLLDAVRK